MGSEEGGKGEEELGRERVRYFTTRTHVHPLTIK